MSGACMCVREFVRVCVCLYVWLRQRNSCISVLLAHQCRFVTLLITNHHSFKGTCVCVCTCTCVCTSVRECWKQMTSIFFFLGCDYKARIRQGLFHCKVRTRAYWCSDKDAVYVLLGSEAASWYQSRSKFKWFELWVQCTTRRDSAFAYFGLNRSPCGKTMEQPVQKGVEADHVQAETQLKVASVKPLDVVCSCCSVLP